MCPLSKTAQGDVPRAPLASFSYISYVCTCVHTCGGSLPPFPPCTLPTLHRQSEQRLSVRASPRSWFPVGETHSWVCKVIAYSQDHLLQVECSFPTGSLPLNKTGLFQNGLLGREFLPSVVVALACFYSTQWWGTEVQWSEIILVPQ